MLKAGVAGIHAAQARGRSERLEPMVELQVRGQLAPAIRPPLLDQWLGRPSRRPHCLSRCRSLRKMGRQGIADGSGVGVCGARRSRWRRVRLGRRVRARRAPDGEHLAGRVPARESRTDGYARTSPVRRFRRTATASATWSAMSGKDHRLVVEQTRSRRAESVLHSGKSRGGPEAASYDPASPTSEFRARCSRAARTCARRTTAAAIGRPRATRAVDTSTSHAGSAAS